MANLNPRNRQRDDPNQGRLFGDGSAASAPSSNPSSGSAEPVRPAAKSLFDQLGLKSDPKAALDIEKLRRSPSGIEHPLFTLQKICAALQADSGAVAFDEQSRALGYQLRRICIDFCRNRILADEAYASRDTDTALKWGRCGRLLMETTADGVERAHGDSAGREHERLLGWMTEKLETVGSDRMYVLALAYRASLTLSARCPALENQGPPGYRVGTDMVTAFALDTDERRHILQLLLFKSTEGGEPKALTRALKDGIQGIG